MKYAILQPDGLGGPPIPATTAPSFEFLAFLQIRARLSHIPRRRTGCVSLLGSKPRFPKRRNGASETAGAYRLTSASCVRLGFGALR